MNNITELILFSVSLLCCPNDKYFEVQHRYTFKNNIQSVDIHFKNWNSTHCYSGKLCYKNPVLGAWLHMTDISSHLYLYWLVILRKEITHSWCFHDNRPDVFTGKLTFVKSCAKSHAKSHISQEVWSGSSFAGSIPKREFNILPQIICKPMVLESKWAVPIHHPDKLV